jgi:hypothetical protein
MEHQATTRNSRRGAEDLEKDKRFNTEVPEENRRTQRKATATANSRANRQSGDCRSKVVPSWYEDAAVI